MAGFYRSPLAFIIPHRPPRLATTVGGTAQGFRSQFQFAGLPYTHRPTTAAPSGNTIGYRSQFQFAGLPFTRRETGGAAATASAVTGGLYIPIPRRRRRH